MNSFTSGGGRRFGINQEWIIFTAQKLLIISSNSNHISCLNLLFCKEGFSYCTGDDSNSRPKVFEFSVSGPAVWETEVIREFEINLGLRRNFDRVRAGFMSSFFSLVPNEYTDESLENLLNFSEAEFEDNRLLRSATRLGAQFVFGVSQLLTDRLNSLYSRVEYCHSGSVFIDSAPLDDRTVVHLNSYRHNLEILVTAGGNLEFYNLFETLTGEDILFYSLYTLNKLGLDSNSVVVKTYGEMTEGLKVYEILRKYIRNLSQAQKDEVFLKNYSLYNLMKCESSQDHSEERK